MKIVKISSLGCPSCILMNKVFNQIKEKYDFELEELDYDLDSLQQYNPGVIMPEYIFFKDGKEIKRLVGEHKIEDFIEILESEK
jgi:thiol-disulfide isomerase/thioredoxin